MYSSLSTCHVSEDTSIRGDLALIRYDFERNFINDMLWIPGIDPELEYVIQEGGPFGELSREIIPIAFLNLVQVSQISPHLFSMLKAAYSIDSNIRKIFERSGCESSSLRGALPSRTVAIIAGCPSAHIV